MKDSLYPKNGFVFLCTWLPAFLYELVFQLIPTLVFTMDPILHMILRWSFLLLFVFGWTYALGKSTFWYPKKTLGGLLLYLGLSMLLLTLEYNGIAHQLFGSVSPYITGAFHVIPLYGIARILIPLGVPYQLYLVLGLGLYLFVVWLITLGIRKGYRGYDKF